MRDRLQMGWCYTRRIATQMVYFQPLGYGSDKQFVDNPVGQELALVIPHLPVAVAKSACGPQHTAAFCEQCLSQGSFSQGRAHYTPA